MDGVIKPTMASCFKGIAFNMQKYYMSQFGELVGGETVYSPDSKFTLVSMRRREDIKISETDIEYLRVTEQIVGILRRINIKVVYEDIYGKEFAVEKDFGKYIDVVYGNFLKD